MSVRYFQFFLEEWLVREVYFDNPANTGTVARLSTMVNGYEVQINKEYQ